VLKYLLLPLSLLAMLVAGLAFNAGFFDQASANTRIVAGDPSLYGSEGLKGGEEGNIDSSLVLKPGTLPALELKGSDGSVFDPKDLRGKFVLLNLWATWCVPCVEEMPALNNLHKEISGPNFEVVAINYDSEKKTLDKFLEKTPLSFTNLHDPELMSVDSFGTVGFPETFLFGPDGKQLAIFDLEENKFVAKIVADRPWDSEAWVKNIKKMISNR